MKLSIFGLAVALSTMSAYSQPVTQSDRLQYASPQVVVPEKRNYTIQKTNPVTQAVEAPEWFSRLPDDTPDMLFSAGTSQSIDEQTAFDKARLQAERKLVEMMSSRVKSSMKSYRNDTGDALLESTEITVSKNAEGDLIGAQRVDSKTYFDGRKYKVYVLIRYPLGDSNYLRKDRASVTQKRESELRSAKAHQELEQASEKRKAEAEAADQKLKKEIGPKTETTELKLLDVDNEAYKARRDDALKKPGAVIGQTVIQ